MQSGNRAEIYAESILNVCKFYVESPLACVSGVTGSELKRRIVRIMQEQIGKKLDLSRKLMLGLAATVALAVPIVLGLVHIDQISANTASLNLTGDTAGTWQDVIVIDRAERPSEN